MWILLKAELRYRKYWLAANYIVFVLFYALFIVSLLTSLFEVHPINAYLDS